MNGERGVLSPLATLTCSAYLRASKEKQVDTEPWMQLPLKGPGSIQNPQPSLAHEDFTFKEGKAGGSTRVAPRMAACSLYLCNMFCQHSCFIPLR